MRLLHRKNWMNLCWNHGNGIMFRGAEQQAVFLETVTRVFARSWEVGSRGEDRFGCISRNWIRLNIHLAHYLFLVVMGRAGCLGRGGAQSGATFGFGSDGWRLRVTVVFWHLYAVGRTCRKARCLQSPVLAITALRNILCD